MNKENVANSEITPAKMEQILSEDSGQAAQVHLDAGKPVFYGDPFYPGKVIKEYPSGKREVLVFDKQGNEVVELVLWCRNSGFLRGQMAKNFPEWAKPIEAKLSQKHEASLSLSL